MSATVAPSSTREDSGAALRASARSRSASSSARVNSVPVSRWRVMAGGARECTVAQMSVQVLSWNLKHGRAEPVGRALSARRVRRRAGRLGMGRGPAAGGAAVVAARARSRHRSERAQRLDLAQRRVAGAPRAGHPLARLRQVKRGRRKCDARARSRRSSRTPGVVCACGPSAARCTASGCGGSVPGRTLDRQPARHRARHRGRGARQRPEPRRPSCAGQSPAPCVLGGDFNLRELALPGFAHAGGHDVDHVFVHGLRRRRDGRGAGARPSV